MYTIYCAVLGGHSSDNAWPIRMDETRSVGELNEEINIKLKRPSLSPLKMYHVNIVVSEDDTYGAIRASISQRTIALDKKTELQFPFCKLSTKSFPEGCLHIIVDISVPAPAGESFNSKPGRDIVEIVLLLTRRIPPIAMLTTLSPRACCRYIRQLQQLADYPIYTSLVVYYSLQSLPSRPTSMSPDH